MPRSHATLSHRTHPSFSYSCRQGSWPRQLPSALCPALPGVLTQRDGCPALSTAVILAVQPCLGADVQLILGLVADFGPHAGLGDEVQTLAVTAVVTPWLGARQRAS